MRGGRREQFIGHVVSGRGRRGATNVTHTTINIEVERELFGFPKRRKNLIKSIEKYILLSWREEEEREESDSEESREGSKEESQAGTDPSEEGGGKEEDEESSQVEDFSTKSCNLCITFICFACSILIEIGGPPSRM